MESRTYADDMPELLRVWLQDREGVFQEDWLYALATFLLGMQRISYFNVLASFALVAQFDWGEQFITLDDGVRWVDSLTRGQKEALRQEVVEQKDRLEWQTRHRVRGWKKGAFNQTTHEQIGEQLKLRNRLEWSRQLLLQVQDPVLKRLGELLEDPLRCFDEAVSETLYGVLCMNGREEGDPHFVLRVSRETFGGMPRGDYRILIDELAALAAMPQPSWLARICLAPPLDLARWLRGQPGQRDLKWLRPQVQLLVAPRQITPLHIALSYALCWVYAHYKGPGSGAARWLALRSPEWQVALIHLVNAEMAWISQTLQGIEETGLGDSSPEDVRMLLEARDRLECLLLMLSCATQLRTVPEPGAPHFPDRRGLGGIQEAITKALPRFDEKAKEMLGPHLRRGEETGELLFEGKPLGSGQLNTLVDPSFRYQADVTNWSRQHVPQHNWLRDVVMG